MLENGYPFGAIINKNMMNDEYQRTNWPVLFNYGVAENEMKWRSCCNKDQAVQVLGYSRSRSGVRRTGRPSLRALITITIAKWKINVERIVNIPLKIIPSPIVFLLSLKSGVSRLGVMLLSGQFLEKIRIGSTQIQLWKSFILELMILLIATKDWKIHTLGYLIVYLIN